MKELRVLKDLGIKHVNMYADLFTVNREQVMGLCKLTDRREAGADLDMQQPRRLRR